jgi:Xaa-Pro aminopeptidase
LERRAERIGNPFYGEDLMLTAAGCQARRQRLWALIPEEIEWLLVADPRHVHYLANFQVNPFSFSAGERALLLLDRNQGATLLADNFTIRSAVSPPHVNEIVNQKWYDHKHAVINRDHALLAALQSVSSRLVRRSGLVETEALPVAAAQLLDEWPPRFTLSDGTTLGGLLRTMRRRKDADELEIIRTAMRATDAGHARAREFVQAGVSEWDMYREVQTAVLQALQHPAIVYGDFLALNAQQPKAGGLPTGYTLQNGDLFLLDYSVAVEGYRSDFTNTLAVGEPTPDQRRLFALCEAALQAGEAALRGGVAAKSVYDAVIGPFREAGVEQYFPHHAGHGLGLGHPEPPIIVSETTDTLETGDVITLEPGLYVEGIGGMRIEHNYLITDTGCERLSNHTIALQ